MLIVIDFPEIPSNTHQLYLGMTDSVGDTLAGAEPIPITPGSNIYGFSTISVKEQIVNEQAATFGIPQVSHSCS